MPPVVHVGQHHRHPLKFFLTASESKQNAHLCRVGVLFSIQRPATCTRFSSTSVNSVNTVVRARYTAASVTYTGTN